ncbi:MAG: hypothetical protein LBW85_07640 [Deltaproteobacteria bacterium]|nr:hypothetical protein [Deltaproteobacteria bacterium]
MYIALLVLAGALLLGAAAWYFFVLPQVIAPPPSQTGASGEPPPASHGSAGHGTPAGDGVISAAAQASPRPEASEAGPAAGLPMKPASRVSRTVRHTAPETGSWAH